MDEIVKKEGTLLMVDDEKSVRESLKVVFEERYTLIEAGSGAEALAAFNMHEIDLVLLDIVLPDMNGIDILKLLKQKDNLTDVVMITALHTIDTAVAAMKNGALDYITKPFEVAKLRTLVRGAIENRKLKLENTFLKNEFLNSLHGYQMIGPSERIKDCVDLAVKLSDTDSTVLISGETGVGKELVAKIIHFSGCRKNNNFVPVNCAAVPEELFESELFGHERGAFTSAINKKVGKFEFANDGTLFLDEVSAMPLNIQAKFLRVLQEKEITRVGSNISIKVNPRIIAATNIDLKKAVKNGQFRDDLFWRLSVVGILVPPLRERTEDIEPLVNSFLQKHSTRLGIPLHTISNDAMNVFKAYNWPGNVREMENVIERLLVTVPGEEIRIEHLPMDILVASLKVDPALSERCLKEARGNFEKQFIEHVFVKTKGNQSKAALILGVHRNTIIKKMHELDIDHRKFKRKIVGK